MANTMSKVYLSYDRVPFYRKQWFFWLMFFTLPPIAMGILLFGDVYYEKRAEVKSFGVLNRIFAGLGAVFVLVKIFGAFVG